MTTKRRAACVGAQTAQLKSLFKQGSVQKYSVFIQTTRGNFIAVKRIVEFRCGADGSLNFCVRNGSGYSWYSAEPGKFVYLFGSDNDRP